MKLWRRTVKTSIITASIKVILALALVVTLTIMPAPVRAAAGELDHFKVEMSSISFPAGTTCTVNVTAEDDANDTVTDYAGQIQFSTNDPSANATLPTPYLFVPANDNGSHVFEVTLVSRTTVGWVKAAVVGDATKYGEQTGITVTPLPMDHVGITPDSQAVAVEGSVSFTAVGEDLYNNAVSPQAENFTWSWGGTALQGGINAATGVFTAENITGIYTDEIEVSANQTVDGSLYSKTGTAEVVVCDDVVDIRLLEVDAGSTTDLTINDIFALKIQVEPNGSPVEAVDAFITYSKTYLRLVDSSGTAITVGGAAVTPDTSALGYAGLTNTMPSEGNISFSIATSVATPTRPTDTFTIGTFYLKAIKPTSNTIIPFVTASTHLVYGGTNWLNQSFHFGVDISPGPIHHLTVTGTAEMDAGSSNQLTIRARDVHENVVTSYNGTQSLIFRGPAASVSGDAPTVTDNTSANVTVGVSTTIIFTDGVSTIFTNGVSTAGGSLFAYKAETTHVDVTDSDGYGSSANASWGLALTVNPLTVDYLGVTGTAAMDAGSTNQLTVTAHDQYGNTATTYNGGKTLTFSGPAASPSGTVPTVTDNESAEVNVGVSTNITFTSGISTAGGGLLKAYKAQATTVDVVDANVTTINSTANADYDLDLTVNAATASDLKVTGTATMLAGATNQLTIRAYDEYGNIATGYTTAKSLIFSGPAASPSGIVATVTNNAGTAVNIETATTITFTSGNSTAGGLLRAYKTETSDVDVVDANVTTINSTADAAYDLGLTVNPAVASKLVYDTSNLPPTAVAEDAIWPTFLVEIQDQYGNLRDADDTANVTVAASVGTLSGNTTKLASSGVATFDGISYPDPTPTTPITVIATSTGLTLATSASVWVTPVITANISLGADWNIFSTPFALRQNYKTWGQLDTVVSGGLDVEPTSVVYTYDASLTSPWVQCISTTEVRPLDAYFVKMASADNISLVADTEVGATDSLRSKTIPAGWNLVGLGYRYGYLTIEPAGATADGMDVQTALASVEYIGGDEAVHGYAYVVSPGYNDTSWVYFWGVDPGTPVKGEADFMCTGKGYWVFMEAEDTLGAFTQTPLATP